VSSGDVGFVSCRTRYGYCVRLFDALRRQRTDQIMLSAATCRRQQLFGSWSSVFRLSVQRRRQQDAVDDFCRRSLHRLIRTRCLDAVDPDLQSQCVKHSKVTAQVPTFILLEARSCRTVRRSVGLFTYLAVHATLPLLIIHDDVLRRGTAADAVDVVAARGDAGRLKPGVNY